MERLASEMANRCWVSFGGPHEPWDTPEPWSSHYDPEQMPPALRGDLRSGDRPRGQLDALFPRMPALTPADVAALRANYAGNVSLIDDQIGQLFAAIERRGEWQNTVVVLCSAWRDEWRLRPDLATSCTSEPLDGSNAAATG